MVNVKINTIDCHFFSKFFNLPETIEFNTNEDIIGELTEKETETDNETETDYEVKTLDSNSCQLNEILNPNKNKSDVIDSTSDTNSELSYELYCYSDEEP